MAPTLPKVIRTCHRCGSQVEGEVDLFVVYFRCRGHRNPRTKNPCLHQWREPRKV